MLYIIVVAASFSACFAADLKEAGNLIAFADDVAIEVSSKSQAIDQDNTNTVTGILIGLSACLVLAVLYFVLRRRARFNSRNSDDGFRSMVKNQVVDLEITEPEKTEPEKTVPEYTVPEKTEPVQAEKPPAQAVSDPPSI